MQTLILSQQPDKILTKYHLEEFASLTSSSMILDSIKTVIVKGGRLHSKGQYNFDQLKHRIELFPSFLIIADSIVDTDEIPINDETNTDEDSYKKLDNCLFKGHPYCQQLFFNSPQLEQFFSGYLSENHRLNQSHNAEAFVHIASIRERVITVYNIDYADENITIENKDIEIQLQYEFANFYYTLVSEMEYHHHTEIDKSIFLNVKFQLDSKVDIKIQLTGISIIDITNFHHFPACYSLLEQMLQDLMQVKQQSNAERGSNNKHYIRACNELDVSCEPITRNKYLLQKDQKKAIYIPYHKTIQSKQAIELASSKEQASKVLKENGFEVSNNISLHVNDVDPAMIDKIFSQLKTPLVIKPTDQSAGYGVYLNINNRQSFETAINDLKDLEKVNDIIVEEQFDGCLYRFIIIGKEVVAVLKSNYPLICGNGRDTLSSLIKQYNNFNQRKIRINDTMKHYLDSIDINLQTVLKKGQLVTVSLKKNGDVTQEIGDHINEKFKQIALQVNQIAGLTVNGVDMMISKEGNYKIIELNAVPALYPHLQPNYGVSLDLFKNIIEYTLDNCSDEFYNCSKICNYHG